MNTWKGRGVSASHCGVIVLHMMCTKMHQERLKCPFYQEMDDISHSGRIKNTLLCQAILVRFSAFWCTSCATLWPHNDLHWLLYPSKCPFTPEMDHISHSGQIRDTLLWNEMETTLMHFGPFWCTSWATPRPLCIEFSSSHQEYASYTSSALKHNQTHLSSPEDTNQTWTLSMGYGRKNHFFSRNFNNNKNMPSLCRGDF